MKRRCVILGAIGGDKQEDAARAFGAAVAEAGCILLTGGGDRDDDEVKNASIHGAMTAERRGAAVARFVGILPSQRLNWATFPAPAPRPYGANTQCAQRNQRRYA